VAGQNNKQQQLYFSNIHPFVCNSGEWEMFEDNFKDKQDQQNIGYPWFRGSK
jgi:hypothetical protein